MQNIDGIKKIKTTKKILSPVVKIKHLMPVDAIGRSSQPQISLPTQPQRQFVALYSGIKKLKRYFTGVKTSLRIPNFKRQIMPAYVLAAALVLAFGGGAWAALSTQKTEAENTAPTKAGSMPIETGNSLGPINNVSNDVLFNMTIGQLESYLNSIAQQNRETKAAEQLAIRKTKLREYLKSKKSPFADVADVIAEQKHWKLIMAISFAESTFGRNCVDNNCSNIGVKPGHPYWHQYATLADWVKDFNKLLERKYSDWTLEEMNGVYVQPKNPNWLAATRQVLEELQAQGIE
ncbi:MAG: hypothetical protein HY918_03260 [Candidatus Doudnabacteria bacterium]|nr:hypothetical protein [Candidatus Doudnabacteria bacterium]